MLQTSEDSRDTSDMLIIVFMIALLFVSFRVKGSSGGCVALTERAGRHCPLDDQTLRHPWNRKLL